MRKSLIGSLLVLGAMPAFIAVGCADSFEDCENNATCSPPDGDGDGTGGSGDGDGDNVGGVGGDVTDPCDECEGDTPVCNDLYVCVECTGDEHCDGDTPVCGDEVCVECNLDADCSDPTKPLCQSGECAGCTDDDSCGDLGNRCLGTGECVECTAETEADDCGAKSCDPATFTCGPHDRESRGTCDSCVSDSDCETNHHCVPMEFPTGTALGGFCLELSGSCERPYTVVLSDRTTLSGSSGDSYCGVSEDATSCPAVQALEDDWRCDASGAGDGTCWPFGGSVADAVEIPGALCRKFDGLGGDRCTFECAGDTDCKAAGAGSMCGAGVMPDPITPDYCGGTP